MTKLQEFFQKLEDAAKHRGVSVVRGYAYLNKNKNTHKVNAVRITYANFTSKCKNFTHIDSIVSFRGGEYMFGAAHNFFDDAGQAIDAALKHKDEVYMRNRGRDNHSKLLLKDLLSEA